MTQKTLSAFRSDGRGLCRFRTDTCCRRARISVWSAARSAKISMILCMPERVSGGDAKFQGFCDRWYKWEGHRRRWRNWLRSSKIPMMGDCRLWRARHLACWLSNSVLLRPGSRRWRQRFWHGTAPTRRAAVLRRVNGGAKLVHPGGAKLVHLMLCGTRCWGVVPVVHRRDPRCFV